MLPIDDLNTWKLLSSPFGNSSEIPALILELQERPTVKLSEEIVWEYIYHQGSVYENTLATFPYLVNIIKSASDPTFKIELTISLGVVFIQFQDIDQIIKGLFSNTSLGHKHQRLISESFKIAVDELKEIIKNSKAAIHKLSEESKRFFLAAYLATINHFKAASVFTTFFGNDEYVSVCPNCEADYFLWNESDALNAYSEDPVSNTTQKKQLIQPIEHNSDLDWLKTAVYEYSIDSLKPILPYFNSNLACHNCGQVNNVFEGVLNSY